MSNYNADIRIGVVGQSKLKTLQKDLDKVNASVKKLNKALVLKTRAQTIKLNTKGATTAIKKLEDRINKLGRTVTVNVRTNDRKGSSNSSSSGGGSFGSAGAVASLGAATKNQQALDRLAKSQLDTAIKKEKTSAQALKDQKDITALNKDLLDTQEELTKAQSAYTDKTEKVADLERRRNAAAGQAKSLQTRLNKGQIKNVEAVKNAKVQMAEYKALASDLNSQIGNANKGYGNTNKLLERSNTLSKSLNEKEKQLTQTVNARAKAQVRSQKFKKGFGAGAGVAGASAAGNIPVLGDAVTGGLVASFTGGSVAAGALGGALVGVISGLAAVGSQAAVTRAQFDKLNISLKLASGDEYAASVEAIRRVVDDFNAPLVDTTEQFTKLYAASQGSGIAFSELEDLFVGLSAANKAYAGDAEDLNGILRAFTQIISKGTVQSEELKGQVGERLPGAFKKAADSLGLTTAQLQKALEQGEIQSADFVKAFGKYMLQYEEDAKIIASSPAEAGARLEVALVDLNNRIGPVFASLGAQFQDFATAAVNALIPVIDYLNQLFDVGSNADRLDQKIGKVLTLNQKIFDVETKRNGLTDKTARNALAEDLASLTNRRDILQGEADELRKLLGAQKRTTEAANTIKPTTLEDPKTLKTGGGGKSGPSDTTAQTRVEIQLQQELLRIEKEKYDLVGKEASLQDFDLQRQELKAGLAASLQQIDQDNITAASKIAEKELERLKYSTDLQAIKNAEKEFTIEQTKAFEDQVLELQNAIALESAITDEMKRQAELKIALADIDRSDLNPERKAELTRLTEDLAKLQDTNADPLNQYFNQLTEKVGDTRGQVASLAQTFESELGTAISSSITGLIDGTTTVQEAFADMFKNIGKAFIDMAAQMLAQKAVLALLSAFAGGGSNYGGVPGGRGPQFFGPAFSGGGYTGDAPRTGGVDGRGGFPAILHPQETVVDHHASASNAMSAYGPNNSGGGGGAGSSVNVHYDGPTLKFNQDDYLPVSAVPGIIKQAASAGEKQTMNKMRNSPAARRRAGI